MTDIANPDEKREPGVAWLFPGQGSQYVGMGQRLAESEPTAAAVFKVADEVLGFLLSDIIFNGPATELERTDIQQPAILAVSVAYLTVLQERGVVPQPRLLAGHSLGEYSAMVAAGALSFPTAIRLVRRRGELMRRHGVGGMVAVLGLSPDVVAAIAEEAGAEVANFNAPAQTVVSGRDDALDRVLILAKERQAKRAIRLPVTGAFHSSLMRPVVEGLRPLLEDATFSEPMVPVLSNVDARPISTSSELRQELLDQICAPVNWIQVIQHVHSSGIVRCLEIGPGKVLAGLTGRIASDMSCESTELLLARRS